MFTSPSPDAKFVSASGGMKSTTFALAGGLWGLDSMNRFEFAYPFDQDRPTFSCFCRKVLSFLPGALGHGALTKPMPRLVSGFELIAFVGFPSTMDSNLSLNS